MALHQAIRLGEFGAGRDSANASSKAKLLDFGTAELCAIVDSSSAKITEKMGHFTN